MQFAAGYGMAMLSYVQFFYICELGENVKVRVRILSLNHIFDT